MNESLEIKPVSTNAPPWGTYRPTGYKRFLRLLVKLGFSHGVTKRWFQRRWFSSGERTPVDLVYHGVKFRLHPYDNIIETRILLGSRARDDQEIRMLLENLPAGGVFLDVGANIGYYSLIAVACGAYRALAVEPIPAAYERLAFNICANGFQDRVIAIQTALGAERKTVCLSVAEGDLGGSSIVKSEIQGQQLQVPMMPLAEVLAERRIMKVDAMKIDVEGMEDLVLCPFYESAQEALWPRFVIMEHVHGKDWKQNVLAFMLDRGYEQVGKNRSNVFLRFPRKPA